MVVTPAVERMSHVVEVVGSNPAWYRAFSFTLFSIMSINSLDRCKIYIYFLLPYLALTLVCRKMAWLGIIFLYLNGFARSRNLSCLDPFNFLTSYARGEKPFGLELELNPRSLASQATALTTRPCLLGRVQYR